MSTDASIYRIGDATVTKLPELCSSAFPYGGLYPGVDPAKFERNHKRVGSESVDALTRNPILSIHSWLVRTPHHTILIDTASGNGKPRPFAPLFENLDEPYIERLASAGVTPEDVDYVLLTHLHVDHVGWNTRLDGGRWVPTFPKAKYVFSDIERKYNESLAANEEPHGEGRPNGTLGPPVGRPFPLVYDDSVRPVIDAGLAQTIRLGGDEVLEGISFIPTPGHSVDHASIRLLSRGEEALFSGDVLHHPIQVYETDINSCFCEFPDAALKSRLWALEHAAERNTTVFTTHFPETSVGHIRRKGDLFSWEFS